MPIRVRIDVNGDKDRTIWIGRLSGTSHKDSLNTYLVGREEDGKQPWIHGYFGLPHFTHRYGDGLMVCVSKALEALDKHEAKELHTGQDNDDQGSAK